MKRLTKITLMTFVLGMVASGLLAASSGQVPHLINYQGRLTDTGGTPLEGSYNLTFRIYDTEIAGVPLWEETQSGVVIQKGIFSVLLGAVTPLNLTFDKQYYLEIKVGDDAPMTPRQQITSAGYAIRAEHGVPQGVIVMWSGTIATIPSGWALCDGTNGTPDLHDRFIVGAKQDDGGVAKTGITGALAKSGGSTAISEANLPSHAHGAGTLVADSNGAHTHTGNVVVSGGMTVGVGATLGARYSLSASTGSGGAHTHTISGSTAATGSGTAYTQPYYALAFIMKIN